MKAPVVGWVLFFYLIFCYDKRGVKFMSVLSAVFMKAGIIMSSDSRLTSERTINGIKCISRKDVLQKTFLLSAINVGISYCGNVNVAGKPFHEFIKDFAKNEVEKDDTAYSIATKLFNVKDRDGTTILVCGYIDGIPYVYCIIGNRMERMNVDDDGNVIYSVLVLGGNRFPQKYLDDEISGRYSLLTLSLKNGITLAENLVVVAIQNVSSCGAPINTLVIQANTAFWHQCHCTNEIL
jgi:hypothetical protein